MQYHRLPKIEELRAYETHKIRDWKNVFSMSSDEGQMFVKDFHARWMSEDRKTYVVKNWNVFGSHQKLDGYLQQILSQGYVVAVKKHLLQHLLASDTQSRRKNKTINTHQR